MRIVGCSQVKLPHILFACNVFPDQVNFLPVGKSFTAIEQHGTPSCDRYEKNNTERFKTRSVPEINDEP